MKLTLGGMHPLAPYWILPGTGQSWWKPCLHRAEGSTDTHVWFLSPTSSGSLYCPDCRARAPRVIVGPKEWIAEIREANEAGDTRRVRDLLAAGPSGCLPELPEVLPVDQIPQVPEKPQQKVDVRPSNRKQPEDLPVAPTFKPKNRADWFEFYTERAAIFQFLGGIERGEAEMRARELAGAPP